MEQKNENALVEKVQVIEFEKDGVLLTFGEKDIRDLIAAKEFWFRQWNEVKSKHNVLTEQIESARPYLEKITLYQVLTTNKD